MKRNKWVGILWVGAVAIVTLVVAGCEENSDVTEGVLTIDPTTAQVTTNLPSITFKASGGTGVYIWSVVNPSIGTVMSSGDSAVYSALRMTSTVTTNSVATNNALVRGGNFVVVTDDDGNMASASVTQTPLP